ncbi:AAA family ATPase [Zhihengliuella salsuginis]|uniref:AAA family ATPase n=1 Tax=Zhihengliuella salsuginis TaxID=578222 RepID=UPI00167ACA9D|nr:AAA family ATPase [Zhihengliuella salsuginis]
MARLIALAGLPGTGKSTTAAALAARLGAVLLGVDPLEAAIVSAGVQQNRQPTGHAAYAAVEAAAEPQLRNGLDVVIDAVNDSAEARGQWKRLAARTGAELTWFEVVCSDPTVHRMRLQQRKRAEDQLIGAPTWVSLNRRRLKLALWKDPRHVLDSRHATAAELAARAESLVEAATTP